MIGGRVTLAIEPQSLRQLAMGRQLALISGTNGKTTTTRLFAAALATRGPVSHNLGGANLPAGVVSALTDSPTALSGALEVDEAWLGTVSDAVAPSCIVLLNLSRDQLDRVSEVRSLASKWRDVAARSPETVFVANADDPIVAWAAMGALQQRWVAAGHPWKADATGCPSCGGRIAYSENDWRCTGVCGLSRPKPAAWLEGTSIVTEKGERYEVQMQLPGRFNLANAAMAAVGACELGVPMQVGLASMAEVSDVQGRYATIPAKGLQGEAISARLLLAKNPAGWVELFGLLTAPSRPVVLAINARVADGTDPSWLWDVPFEALRGRHVIASGERSRDLAVRLHYAEVDHSSEPDLRLAIARAHASLGAGVGSTEQPYLLDVVANYTAFQQLRRTAMDISPPTRRGTGRAQLMRLSSDLVDKATKIATRINRERGALK